MCERCQEEGTDLTEENTRDSKPDQKDESKVEDSLSRDEEDKKDSERA